MEKIKLNETPVRTCRNYNVNNIIFEDEIPDKIGEFNSLKINNESQKDEIIQDNKLKDFDIKYGTGLIFQIEKNSNKSIKIIINSKTDKFIKLEFDFDDDNLNLIENIEIVGKENTTSNIYIVYRKKSNKKAFHNGLIRVIAENNSNITLNIVNLMNDESSNILSIDGKLGEKSVLNYNIIDFGGKNSITNLYTNLSGKESENVINTIYLGKNKDIIDINYIAECFGKKTKINMDIQGALKDEAKKTFKGTIDFKKGAKSSIGDEVENCILLSDRSKSLAVPMLLCSEEDVEGNHATSSGKVGDKELFYIMSRGFSRKEAEKLLVRAKFNKVIDNIKNQEVKNEILYEIDQILD